MLNPAAIAQARKCIVLIQAKLGMVFIRKMEDKLIEQAAGEVLGIT